MSPDHRFRFGAICIGRHSVESLAELARRVEGEGFDTLLAADHYTPDPMSCGPLLLAAANATTTLRVGSYVYNNDFRHPALPAKEAATIDILSNGRLELGLGAGYRAGEYDAVGLAFDPPSVRAGRFEEATEIHPAPESRDRRLQWQTLPSLGISRHPKAPPTAGGAPHCRRWPAHAAPGRAYG